MCDFNKIAGLIIAAQVAFLVSLGIVAGAIVLGSNPFTSAANIPAMIISAVAAAAATALMAGAIAALDECASGPCGSQVASLRSNLLALSIAMGAYCILLAALALIAWIPFAGSAAAATVCIWAVGTVTLFAAVTEGMMGNAIQGFNACMASRGNSGATTVIVVLTVATVLVGLVVSAGAGVSGGVLPCFIPALC